ncbi:hypothetical protein DEU56DRAFT_743969 [Suillus clintonianus]|uniref:uncharacterized protein n=1 Tax=Suillus clintonianus TaxID=1904413 RepID=UPI001B86A09D|nr:uncharacterized protein DEU56DRAFT_743969 [Suillus clintonianus]KAG2125163.1 hypothetical protein DEU56DRAFT_743969 [Suillus clintonianus]
MNYTDYECKIVKHHGVKLVNWPLCGLVCNPSKVGGRNEVENLWEALDKGTCHWVILSDNHHKHGCSSTVSATPGVNQCM